MQGPARLALAIKRARLVMKGSELYYPHEIYDALSIKPFATPPRVEEPRP